MARIRTAAASAAFVVCVSGCGSAGFQIREAVGLDKNPPDAFVVSPTRALEIPRDLTALPPPSPGAASPLEPDPRALALSALSGQPAGAATAIRSTPNLTQSPIYNSGGPAAPVYGAPVSGAAPVYGAAPLAAASAPSGAESALLSAAGAQNLPPDLRAAIDAEAAAQPEYLLDRWFPALQRLRGEAAGERIEPLAEMRRLGQDAPAQATPADGRVVSPLLIPPSATAP